ncbi:MAG: hypothetical protein SGI88_05350 [Candidatus Hydrogenedentes bacterium]|nr:hypothetical protein [Candidatus Hydrogenedentota bacterium]
MNWRLCIAMGIMLSAFAAEPLRGIETDTFEQEIGRKFGVEHGLPDKDVLGIALTREDRVYAATAKGLARFDPDKNVWNPVEGLDSVPLVAVAHHGPNVLAATPDTVYVVSQLSADALFALPDENGSITCLLAGTDDGDGMVGTTKGVFLFDQSGIQPIPDLAVLLADAPHVHGIAFNSKYEIAVAADAGLFLMDQEKNWSAQTPDDGRRRWDLVNVRGVSYLGDESLWFASPQGIGSKSGELWKLYSTEDGLPYDEFSCTAPFAHETAWFGTKLGALSFDGEHWGYRQGKRWLPGDDVRAIAVDKNGAAWFATDNGVGVIERVPMTLKEKAKRFEDQIDKYHRRTPYEFVLSVSLDKPGDLEGGFKQHDSDNDGLWTGMYGAGECFAYAATKDPKAKERAKKAFEALRFLGEVTQGGELSPPKGFVARSIMPTDGPDPNVGRDDAKKQREEDALWKTHSPWWPKSADGKWYWKSDTSSDELDGHYFFYACYYDLVAETDEEKARVREHVLALTDHLIDHDFDLVDYDGKPTRWGRYSPKNWDDVASWWAGRGLNSLSILSYLKVAEHMSGGDSKYRDAYEYLVKEHRYDLNTMIPKWQLCPGCGNQSDDEMGFMSFYNLMKYEDDPQRKENYAFAFYNYWMIEEPELNPLFNYMYASQCWGMEHVNPWGPIDLTPRGTWLKDSLDTLERYPLDRIEWSITNGHRKDIVPLRPHTRERGGERGHGHLPSGYVLPIDERSVEHWSQDAWALDYGGAGRQLSDPASFLLPYYMGLYHGFILEN